MQSFFTVLFVHVDTIPKFYCITKPSFTIVVFARVGVLFELCVVGVWFFIVLFGPMKLTRHVLCQYLGPRLQQRRVRL